MPDRIEPGDATLSHLQHKVDDTHRNLNPKGSGGSMPFQDPQDADVPRACINQGALNNRVLLLGGRFPRAG